MHHLLNVRSIWIWFCIVGITREEWVEIAQGSDAENSHKVGGALSGVLGGDKFKSISLNSTSRPNQAWLDYQIERFGLNVKPTRHSPVISNTNKLIVADRIGYSHHGLATTHQFSVPLKVTDRFHDDHQGHETVIEINNRPQTSKKATAILSHRNKIEVTSIKHPPDHWDQIAESSNDQEKATESTPSESTNEPTMSPLQKILKYMKSFHKTFIAKTSMGIQKKVEYLHWLKDHLLVEIEERLNTLWPLEPKDLTEEEYDVRGRSKRGALFDDSSISFPSTEGALMTINFLTFAVFLIKLVLQVINTVKSKHYKYNGLNVNTMGAIKIGKSRETRSIYPENYSYLPMMHGNIDAERVLQLLNN